MYIWARCSISALLLLLVNIFKNKKKLLSKSACFSCPCSKTPSYPSPPAVCQALLGVSAQSKIPSLKWVSQMSIFQKVGDIQQIQSCFFSAPFLTKSIVLLCLNHCLYENKCNGFSAICWLELHLQHVAKVFQIVIERQAQGSTWAFQLWKFPLVMLVVKVAKDYWSTISPVFCRSANRLDLKNTSFFSI